MHRKLRRQSKATEQRKHQTLQINRFQGTKVPSPDHPFIKLQSEDWRFVFGHVFVLERCQDCSHSGESPSLGTWINDNLFPHTTYGPAIGLPIRPGVVLGVNVGIYMAVPVSGSY